MRRLKYFIKFISEDVEMSALNKEDYFNRPYPSAFVRIEMVTQNNAIFGKSFKHKSMKNSKNNVKNKYNNFFKFIKIILKNCIML